MVYLIEAIRLIVALTAAAAWALGLGLLARDVTRLLP
jgi:hypothetical protein